MRTPGRKPGPVKAGKCPSFPADSRPQNRDSDAVLGPQPANLNLAGIERSDPVPCSSSSGGIQLDPLDELCVFFSNSLQIILQPPDQTSVSCGERLRKLLHQGSLLANCPAWSYERFVQDNDAALGQTVELVFQSPCWKDTVIFVVEDDVQNGLDHVNGERSIFLAISPCRYFVL